MKSFSFDVVAGPDARVLILGTLPGAMSLAMRQYYAQPRNAFWPIMGALVGAAPALPYEARLRRLVDRRIALWDVCASAVRPGSLDAAIQTGSIEANDIGTFLESHAGVGLLCFNGARASEIFRRVILPGLPAPAGVIRRLTLPSTSPAHASMPFKRKLQIWRAALEP